MRNVEFRRSPATLAVAFLSLAISAPLAAQIPDEFTNLQLLPKDIGKRELVETMRNWAGDLGVRCKYCHVGPDNLQGMDFATDQKPEKRTARRMLAMSRAINGELLAALPTVDGDSSHQVVSCFTCHRRQQKPPRNIVQLLSNVQESDGVEEALAEYGRLRESHFAAGQYDFTVATLNRLANRLLEGGKPEDALAVLEANRGYFAESADLEGAFGFYYLRTGELDRAKASFEKALEIDPEHGGSRFGLSRIEAMRPKPEE